MEVEQPNSLLRTVRLLAPDKFLPIAPDFVPLPREVVLGFRPAAFDMFP
jgi:hypothetical protein